MGKIGDIELTRPNQSWDQTATAPFLIRKLALVKGWRDIDLVSLSMIIADYHFETSETPSDILCATFFHSGDIDDFLNMSVIFLSVPGFQVKNVVTIPWQVDPPKVRHVDTKKDRFMVIWPSGFSWKKIEWFSIGNGLPIGSNNLGKGNVVLCVDIGL